MTNDVDIAAIIDSFPPRLVQDASPALGGPYEVVSKRNPPDSLDIVRAAWSDRQLPSQLTSLWTILSTAYLLYADGEDGLMLLDSRSSSERTGLVLADMEEEGFYKPDDVVVGEFQGLDDLLVYSADDGWLVSGPIDERDYWTRLGQNLGEFLVAYRDTAGIPDMWKASFL